MSSPSTPPGYDSLADMIPPHLSGTRTPPRPSVADVNTDTNLELEAAEPTPTLTQGSLSTGTSPSLASPSPSTESNFSAEEFGADISSSSTETEAPVAGLGIGNGRSVGKAQGKSGVAGGTGAGADTPRAGLRGQPPKRLPVKTSQQVIREVDEKMEGVVKRVEEITDRIYLVCKPLSDKALSFAENRPLLFTFVSLWAFFSAIPILFFLGFLAFAAVSIASVAAFFICVTVIGIALAAVSALIGTLVLSSAILLPILCFTTLLATSSLAFLLTLFLAHRLYLHLAASTSEEISAQTLSAGVRGWAGESVERVEEVVGGGFGVGKALSGASGAAAEKPGNTSSGLEKGASAPNTGVSEKPIARSTTPPTLSSQISSFNEKRGFTPPATAAGRGYRYVASVPLPKGHPERSTTPLESANENVFAPSHL
ncbi:hypothetical protein IAT38_003866 [Cryptococcus sp. DSM 104549]